MVDFMAENKDGRGYLIKRLFDKKDKLLSSSHRISDLWENEKNISEVKKELITIISCLSELKPYASIFDKHYFEKYILGIQEEIVRLGMAETSEGDVRVLWEIALGPELDLICAAVNSIIIKPTKESVKIALTVGIKNYLKLLIEKQKKNF